MCGLVQGGAGSLDPQCWPYVSCDGSHGVRYSHHCPASLRLLSVLWILSPVSGMSTWYDRPWNFVLFLCLIPVGHLSRDFVCILSLNQCNISWISWGPCPPNVLRTNHKIQSPLSRNNGRDISLYLKPSLNSKEQWTNPWPQPLCVSPSKLPQ